MHIYIYVCVCNSASLTHQSVVVGSHFDLRLRGIRLSEEAELGFDVIQEEGAFELKSGTDVEVRPGNQDIECSLEVRGKPSEKV